jgi:hypothetical protein
MFTSIRAGSAARHPSRSLANLVPALLKFGLLVLVRPCYPLAPLWCAPIFIELSRGDSALVRHAVSETETMALFTVRLPLSRIYTK